MLRYLEETVSADVWCRCLRLLKNRVEDMGPGQLDLDTERIIWREFRALPSRIPIAPIGERIRAQAAEHVEVLR